MGNSLATHVEGFGVGMLRCLSRTEARAADEHWVEMAEARIGWSARPSNKHQERRCVLGSRL